MGIYVIGMHRSGTSAVAGVLSALCGLPAGRLAVDSNPSGQWERPDLRPALELTLAWNRATWAHPPREVTALTAPAPLLAYTTRVFARHCAGPFLWKDPRLCLTIDRLTSLPQAEPRIVVVHRDPEQVARSLRERNGWSLERGLALWERTNRNALSRLGGREVYAIDHRTVLADPDGVVDGLGDWLGGVVDRQARARAVATIDRGRQRPTPSLGWPSDLGQRSLTANQRALADHLTRASGPTSLDLGPVGPESPSTGPTLGTAGAAELARRVGRAILALPRRHPLEIAA